jgi:hypothetical protein
MARPGGWRAIATSVVILSTSLLSGCLGFIHPVRQPEHSELALCQSLPQPCKQRVYIFLLHGLDPLDLGNLDGLREYIHSLGFSKTYYGLPYHAFYFEKEIRKIHAEAPTSRFVLIGFSYSAPLVRDMACDMGRAGIPVDLLVYIDGVTLHHRPLDRPANALQVVNILSCFRAAENNLKEAANVQYGDVWHFGASTHPKTLKMLADELTVVAQRVPIIEPVLPPPAEGLEPRPTPRRLPSPLPPNTLPPPLPQNTLPPPTPQNTLPPPLPEPGETSRKGWNFLEPDGQVGGVLGGKPIAESWGAEPATGRER